MKDIFTQKELAERWGMSERTLEQWRYKKTGVPFFRAGGIRYHLQDIIEYEALKVTGKTHGYTTA